MPAALFIETSGSWGRQARSCMRPSVLAPPRVPSRGRFPLRHFQLDSGKGQARACGHPPFLRLIKCSLDCRDVLRCNFFLSRGFRAKLEVVGLGVLFWFQTPLFGAHIHAEASARVFGGLGWEPVKTQLPFSAAERRVVATASRTSACWSPF